MRLFLNDKKLKNGKRCSFVLYVHLTCLVNNQLIKVTLIKELLLPLSCYSYIQSGTLKMSKHWLQEKPNMTVFVFQIVHSFCLYGKYDLEKKHLHFRERMPASSTFLWLWLKVYQHWFYWLHNGKYLVKQSCFNFIVKSRANFHFWHTVISSNKKFPG